MSGVTFVSSGSPISDTTISNGDTLVVLSGGIVSFITVSGGAEVIVSSGGVESFTVLTGGGDFVYSGGIASDTLVITGAEIISGGAAIGTTISGGGFQGISARGSRLGLEWHRRLRLDSRFEKTRMVCLRKP
jgi:antigen 43